MAEEKQMIAFANSIREINRLLPKIPECYVSETLKGTSANVEICYSALLNGDSSGFVKRIGVHKKRRYRFRKDER